MTLIWMTWQFDLMPYFFKFKIPWPKNLQFIWSSNLSVYLIALVILHFLSVLVVAALVVMTGDVNKALFWKGDSNSWTYGPSHVEYLQWLESSTSPLSLTEVIPSHAVLYPFKMKIQESELRTFCIMSTMEFPPKYKLPYTESGRTCSQELSGSFQR